MALHSFAKASVAAPRVALLATLLSLTLPAFAGGLVPLHDEQLAAVHGQDGIVLDIHAPAVQANSIVWETDVGSGVASECGTASGGDAPHACTVFSDVQLQAQDGITLELDWGSDASGTPAIGMQLAWEKIRWQFGLSYHSEYNDARQRSVGTFALDSSGSFGLINHGGLFNSGAQQAQLQWQHQGDLFYRQGEVGTPELSLGDLQFDLRFTQGAVNGQQLGWGTWGVDESGWFMRADHSVADIRFDVMFAQHPQQAWDKDERLALWRMGWLAGLTDAEFRLGSGGLGYGVVGTLRDDDGQLTGVRSDGLHSLAKWNFDTDFALLLGQAGGNETQIWFNNWTRLGGPSASNTTMFQWPMIFDVVHNYQGGFCAGAGAMIASAGDCNGDWVPSVSASDESALGMFVRNAHLHAYNTQVEVLDPTSAQPVTALNWGLVFTLGRLDADMFIYPGGVNQAATGLRFDGTIITQTPGFWQQATHQNTSLRWQAYADTDWRRGSHFMVADTNVGQQGSRFGVGLVNSDLWWQGRDVYLRLTTGDPMLPELPAGIWLDAQGGATYRLRGLLGGGEMMALNEPVKMALLDLNLSTHRFIFAMAPTVPASPTADVPIAFAGLLDFDGEAYLRIIEPSNPNASFQIDQVSGRVGWRDGTLQLQSGQNTDDGQPSLTIRNDLLFGTTATFGGPVAGSAGGPEPLVGRVGYGSETFGRIAVPAGYWESEVTMKIPH